MYRLIEKVQPIKVLCVALFIIGVGVAVCILRTPLERPALTILAPRNVVQALPVYAQFVVTQQLLLSRPIAATRLVVPVFITHSTRELVIDIREEGRLIERWRRPLGSAETGTEATLLQLPFHEPQQLNGRIELTVAASAITDDIKDTAPRLFVEMADTAYPDGNYRIAQNEKQGDVGLQLFEQIPRWQEYSELWSKRGTFFLARGILWVLGILLVAVLPGVLVRTAQPQPTQSHE